MACVGGLLLLPPACIYYTVAVFSLSPLSLSMEIKTQSRGLPVLRCCLLGVPAIPSVAPFVGLVLAPSVVIAHARRRRVVSSSSGHRLPLLACSLPIASVCGAGVSAAVFSLRPPLRASCCLPYRSAGRVAFSSHVVFSSYLLALRWCRIALLPVLSDKTGGAMLLRRSCGVGRSHRFLVGVYFWLGFACFLIHVGGAVPAIWL